MTNGTDTAALRDGAPALFYEHLSGCDVSYAQDGFERCACGRLVRRKGGMSGHKLRRVTEFIAANLGGELSLANIAAEAGMSVFHLTRVFKQETGIAPHAYVMRRRIDLSRELLAASEMRIIDIAARVGFRNQSHYTRSFRRLTGVTPAVYRSLLR